MATTATKDPATIRDVLTADFEQYIAAFNAQDINGVASHLDENIQIYVNGTLSGQGRDKLLPWWQADMDKGRQVEVTQGPTCTINEENNDIAEIKVELRATLPKQGDDDDDVQVQVLDVVYVYCVSTVLQIRHNVMVS
mmetsp:Transcript_30940/g.68528  ORF Transcript_30940/g.68528 Transcript_30940/m.68528 type:complete len:138 (-) Transcript_30940:202-615(-)|eukprot:CAMPEP_0178677256 /NCGR_PEP_ID=MMETSP0698-20121128/36352_1 /TAXON_ID=265572 /ORGANISM="Extubocellulus spinifer, Strain CCMP396" /LENGTH=137 /DNA_ID=CAMNT_0020321549 /DNA_START=125 /DNA_END=538 /DNA_ORIENTATION=+